MEQGMVKVDFFGIYIVEWKIEKAEIQYHKAPYWFHLFRHRYGSIF